VLAAFRLHPEPKSLRPDGWPCDELHRDCVGLLARRPALVPAGAIEHVGKEMNELDDVLAGVVHDEDRIVTRYVDPSHVSFDRFRVLLRAIPKSDLVERTGLSPRTIEMLRRGRALPHPDNQDKLLSAVIEHFSERPVPTFETIERLDRNAIAAEVAELSQRIREESATPIEGEEARRRAREEVARAYTERLRAALGLLGM
jgi:transcriptional regulator with XRE-family HTH domain